MNLTETWTTYVAILEDRAPVTAASIRPPRRADEIAEAERSTTSWTKELREFYSLHDGQNVPSGADYVAVGSLVPDSTFLSLDQLRDLHTFGVDNPHPTDDLGDDWPATILAQEAGETAHTFVPGYVPIAEDGAGGLTCIDTRPGQLQGCVRMFSHESADEGGPLYDSLTDYIESIRRSIVTGSQHTDLTPIFENGILEWRDLTLDALLAAPTPTLAVVRLPFPPIDFRPSQLSDDDDLLDLDIVRRTVMDTARQLHPHSVVEDARAVYRQVPRQRGANMNWWVSMDGSDTVYTAFVTGEGHDVIVIEVPPNGYTIEVDR